ncbi:MAG: hypothetical protein MNPFHGCM_00409 [Gemmatimonadaceae bacterium]|nr:hypothetical protein [Gemmatimonadaceae bacterium]
MRPIPLALLAVVLTSSIGPSTVHAQLARHDREAVVPGGPLLPIGVLKRATARAVFEARPKGSIHERSEHDAPPTLQPQGTDGGNRGRNVLIGAIAGAAAGAVATASVCGDNDGSCLFSPAILFPIGGAAAGMLIALLLTPVR